MYIVQLALKIKASLLIKFYKISNHGSIVRVEILYELRCYFVILLQGVSEQSPTLYLRHFNSSYLW
jgi:hypothetical protein